MASIFDQEELAELCVVPAERVKRALEGEDPAAARELVTELAGTMRTHCGAFLDWLVFTEEYVFEKLGHGAHVRSTRPERFAEIAVRTGMDLENLLKAQDLLADSDNELERKVFEEIAARNRDGAAEAWGRLEGLFRNLHDLRRDAVTDLLGWIYAEHGAEALEAAFLYAGERGWWHQSIPEEFSIDASERLRRLVYFLTVGGFFEMRVTEQDECWNVHLVTCGNCGTQFRDRYRDEDWGFQVVDEKGPMTFGQPAMTVYQTHLAVLHHRFAIDLVGAPWPAIRCAGLDAGCRPCQITVYKDPAATAPEFFEMVGKSKPR